MQTERAGLREYQSWRTKEAIIRSVLLQRYHHCYKPLAQILNLIMGFPGGSDGKESACNAGDPGSIPG